MQNLKEYYYQLKLKKIIRKDFFIMDILKTVRTLNLPDWYIAAGVIRNTVWDVLHGYKTRTSLNLSFQFNA